MKKAYLYTLAAVVLAITMFGFMAQDFDFGLFCGAITAAVFFHVLWRKAYKAK